VWKCAWGAVEVCVWRCGGVSVEVGSPGDHLQHPLQPPSLMNSPVIHEKRMKGRLHVRWVHEWGRVQKKCREAGNARTSACEGAKLTISSTFLEDKVSRAATPMELPSPVPAQESVPATRDRVRAPAAWSGAFALRASPFRCLRFVLLPIPEPMKKNTTKFGHGTQT
jgi:hypothetical protein